MASFDSEFTEYANARTQVLIGTALRLSAGNREAAQDLVQETLTQTYVSWRKVKDPSSRDAYVRRIMVRLAYKRTNRVRVEVSLDEVEPAGEISESTAQVDDHLALVPYLRALPVRQRTAVVLRYYLDLSESETAQTMRCSPGSVKTHTHRALKTLRDSWQSACTPGTDQTPEETRHVRH